MMFRRFLSLTVVVSLVLSSAIGIPAQEIPPPAPPVSNDQSNLSADEATPNSPESESEPSMEAAPEPTPPSDPDQAEVDGKDSRSIESSAPSRPQFQIPTQPEATVDESTGSLTYKYPLELPAGRSGMTPDLALEYDSRDHARPDSIVGLGWKLSIPSIQREPVEGTQNLYTKAYFSSSLFGNLIASTDTSVSPFTLYRTEADEGDYVRFSYNADNTWSAKGKDGRTMVFGENVSSRQDDPNDPSKVYKWMVSRIVDALGNEIRFTYTKDNGQIYPERISYTHHPNSPAVNTVDFFYTMPANYGTTVFNSAFPVTTYKLMTSILATTIVGGDTLRTEYTLTHANAQFIKQRLVTEINANKLLPTVEYAQSFRNSTFFEYSTKQPGWEPGTLSLENIIVPTGDDQVIGKVYTADFDRNGYTDVLVSGQWNNGANVRTQKLGMNDGTNFVDATIDWLPDIPNHTFGTYAAIVDTNGDHLPDLHPRFDAARQYAFYRNTGSGFVADTSGIWEIGTYVPEALVCGPNVGDGHSFDMNAFLFDINNDGRNDILYFGGSSDFRVFLNNGNGFARSFNYTFTPAAGAVFTILPRCTGDLDADGYQTILDVNGDGRADYFHEQYGTYLNTGSGFAHSLAYEIDTDEMDRTGMADFNGDGLLDYIGFKWTGGGNYCTKVFLNDGLKFRLVNPSAPSGCQNSGIWSPSDLSYVASDSRRFGTINDLTADGFPDVFGVIPQNYSSVYARIRAINDGISSWIANPFTGDNWSPLINPSRGKYLDINNDGITDFITSFIRWDGDDMSPKKVYLGKGMVPNRMVRITTPLGAQSAITYATAQTDLSDTDASRIAVVAGIAISNVGHDQPGRTTVFAYEDGVFAIDAATGQKRFAGFHKVTKTESGTDLVPLRVSETYFHQANGTNTETGEPTDTSLALIGKPYLSVIRNHENSLRRETRTVFGVDGLISEPLTGRTSSFVHPTQTTVRSVDPSETVTTGELYEFDAVIGERTQTRELGFVVEGDQGALKKLTDAERYTVTEWAANADGTIVKPKRVELRSGADPSQAITRIDYYYDNQPFGIIGASGNRTNETQWVSGNGGVNATVSYTFDEFGNTLTITNARGATTSFAYDATKSLVASETNQLGHSTSYEYVCGLIKRAVDPNGRVTTYGYSTQGWLYRTTTANTGGNQTVRQFLENVNGFWVVQTETDLVNSFIDRSWQSMDNLGRPVRAVRRLLDHRNATTRGYYLKESKGYDPLGRETTRSLPFGVPDMNSYESRLSIPIPPELITTTTLDVFDRPVMITEPTGITTTAYSGTMTTTTDARGVPKKTKVDAFGNLIEVTEFNGSESYATGYQYDVRNLLTGIRDAQGNVRLFEYNNAGWLIRAEDLHAPGDFTFGVTQFGYDLNGNSVLETQPNGTTVSRTYDALDRAATLDGSGTAGVDFRFVYDLCPNGKGKVCQVVGEVPNGASFTRSLEYGPSGVPTRVVTAALGQTYTTSYFYNRSDEVQRTLYPNGMSIRTVFGEWALPSEIFVTPPNGSESQFASVTYEHTGKPATVTTANGMTTAYSYDATKGYREKSRVVSIDGIPLKSFDYTYDSVNNIVKISELAAQTIFEYDGLNRLVRSVMTGREVEPAIRRYQYDAIGNVLSFAGNRYSYSGVGNANPHAVTRFGFESISYDANGNVSAIGETIFWNNWQNRPDIIQIGKDIVTSAYDETGARFLYSADGESELRAEDNFFVRNGVPESEIKLNNMAIGLIVGPNVYSTFSDHLGSPVLVMGTDRSVAKQLRFGPYGETEDQSGSLNLKSGFTGHQSDRATGLTYMVGRYYDPSLGRFLAQDVMLLDAVKSVAGRGDMKELVKLLADPQNQNSYSYASNNPIKYIDPDGKTAELVFDDTERRVTVNVNVYIRGNDANQEAADRIRGNILGAWDKGWKYKDSATGTEYSVSWNVNVSVFTGGESELQSLLANGDNVIDYFDRAGTSWVEIGSPGVGNKGQFNGVDAAAHEFGHLIGLGDRYHNWSVPTFNPLGFFNSDPVFGKERFTPPQWGWGGNIMANSDKPVEQRNIDELIGGQSQNAIRDPNSPTRRRARVSVR